MRSILRFFNLYPTYDFRYWKSKWSSKLQLLNAVLGAIMAAMVAMPPHVADAIPAFVYMVVGIMVVIVAGATVIVVNSVQPKLAAKMSGLEQ